MGKLRRSEKINGKTYVAKVVKNDDEWTVQWTEDGQPMPAWEYFASDLGDAISTMHAEMDRLMLPALTSEQTEALRLYATKHGKDWRNQLRDDWRTGADVNALPNDMGCYLRQVRNLIGPFRLDSVRV